MEYVYWSTYKKKELQVGRTGLFLSASSFSLVSWLRINKKSLPYHIYYNIYSRPTGSCNDNRIVFVVLGSINITYKDEDFILNQIYQKQIFPNFYYEYFKP